MNHKGIICFLFCFFILFSLETRAQSYRVNKKVFDHRDYVRQDGDKYIPVVAGVTSLILPGLGQMVSGEPLRGFAFFGGALMSVAVMGFGISQLFLGVFASDDSPIHTAGYITFYSGLAALVVIDIWSVFDAVRVAKVNNMYRQSIKENSLGLKLSPFLSNQNLYAQSKPVAGLTLKISF